MSLATIAGLEVVDLRLCMPLSGAWHASIVASVPGQSAPTGLCTLSIDENDVNQLTAKGTPSQTTTQLDTILITLVAGNGGLGKTATPKAYRSTTAGAVLNDLAAAAGETLSSQIASDVLSTNLNRWTLLAQSVGQCLDLLCEHLGLTWRMQLDGTLWVGTESWPTVSPAADIVQYDPMRNGLQYSTEDVLVVPGQVIDGNQVRYAEHKMLLGVLRSHLFFGEDTGASLQRVIKSAMADVDFHALYKATVTSQNSDGTCEVKLDDKRFPAFSRVPIKFGTPQTTAKVQNNARVLVGFDDGWVDSPYVALWESATLTELNFGGGSNFVALANLVLDRLTSIVNGFNNHKHDVGPIGFTTYTSTPPDSPLASPASVAADTVKAR